MSAPASPTLPHVAIIKQVRALKARGLLDDSRFKEAVLAASAARMKAMHDAPPVVTPQARSMPVDTIQPQP